MMRPLRRKLTAMSTAVTGAVLLGMALLCLWLSESSARAQALQSFSNTLTAVSAHLDSQDRLSVTWLRQMESAGNIRLSIRDGGNDLFSMGLSAEDLAEDFELARRQAEQEASGGDSRVFPVKGRGGRNYYAGSCRIRKNGGTLEVLALYDLGPLEGALLRQRLLVFLAVLAAVGLLGAFAWVFTGKMLRPIQENQARQTQFVAAASHELRTPLAAILSAAAAMEGASGTEQAFFGDLIRREGQRMTRLIGDLLTLASADTHSWDIRPQAAEPDMLLLTVYETYLPLAKERGLELTLSLPEQAVPRVSLDRDRMEQVLSILLDNALAYTPSPGRIRLELEWGWGRVWLTVSDSGPGVPKEEREKIFDRFYRGEKSHAGSAHFGLGLSIAREIVRLHRGRLWVEDAPGGGAAFVIQLPSIENFPKLETS